MGSLILPNWLSRRPVETEVPKEPGSEATGLQQAFVSESDRVLDPTKIPDTVLGRMPQPTGWRLLVLPYKGSKKSKGGIEFTDAYIESQSLATVVAYVLGVGPDAYADIKKFPMGPWCKKGQWVMIGRYCGARFRIEGGEVRIINDDEVIATIADPADIFNV
jgi:co-chaperonin GroES (HSP10)